MKWKEIWHTRFSQYFYVHNDGQREAIVKQIYNCLVIIYIGGTSIKLVHTIIVSKSKFVVIETTCLITPQGNFSI